MHTLGIVLLTIAGILSVVDFTNAIDEQEIPAGVATTMVLITILGMYFLLQYK